MKLLSLDNVKGFDHRLKITNIGKGVLTEFIQFPLEKSVNGDLIGDGYEQAEKYGVAKVISYSEGNIELDFIKANLSQFPVKDVVVDFFEDANDASRLWGLSKGGIYSFSRTDRSQSKLVCFKLKGSLERSQRILKKEKEGFRYVHTKTYIACERLFK
jgi:hypothetical protein